MQRLYSFFAMMATALAQNNEMVQVVPDDAAKKITITIGGQPFTTFLYPDTLEKPVLFPVAAANGTVVTRGFPLATRAGDPTDHPHHIGLWFKFENVNGLDFWNNSYAIPQEKKNSYGWIKTDRILEYKQWQARHPLLPCQLDQPGK